MIAQVRGTVAAIGATWVVVDVNGLGLRVGTTPATTSALHIGGEALLHTVMIVREDDMSLYGFAGRDERECFAMCLSASGVGPKLALAIVSVLSPARLTAAVRSEDVGQLTQVPGIGPKGAQKIILELRDRVAALGAGDLPVSPPPAAPWREQVCEGLESLGWPAKDAEAAADSVAELAGSEPAPPVSVLMKAALASLARA
ncbi:Holliday junction branch migration protein RuvA [uncultured Propionibacterium sp.]|uniref:Holliday junction branch migration protein RuvA n=1 Tax=uncultured Propionibacterium sp. TaxID=218066 RepID=UPI00292EF102|nr:Holliday junction branch migration protein RuvA [uncultured Propionibacterium sp.]